jgi:hypothetical protein
MKKIKKKPSLFRSKNPNSRKIDNWRTLFRIDGTRRSLEKALRSNLPGRVSKGNSAEKVREN